MKNQTAEVWTTVTYLDMIVTHTMPRDCIQACCLRSLRRAAIRFINSTIEPTTDLVDSIRNQWGDQL